MIESAAPGAPAPLGDTDSGPDDPRAVLAAVREARRAEYAATATQRALAAAWAAMHEVDTLDQAARGLTPPMGTHPATADRRRPATTDARRRALAGAR